MGIVFFIIFLASGAIMICGVLLEWKWLVDPPEDSWCCYSQAFIMKLFGRKFLKIFTTIMGIIFIVVGIYGISLGV